MRILIVSPRPRNSRTGNDVTSRRWAERLRELGHEAAVRNRYPPAGARAEGGAAGPGRAAAGGEAGGEPADPPFGGAEPDLLVAMHARRSAGSAARWRERRGDRPLVVALTGTDLYRDLEESEEARASVAAADRLVVLQGRAPGRLPPGRRGRTHVIHQSAEPPDPAPEPREEAFEVSVLCHMRPVKDPFRAAEAARLLPEESRVEVVHAGRPLREGLGQRARREERENPRYRWVGELERREALRLLARSRLMALTSRLEGGANVVTEALACGTPVVSSRIEGSVGLLGEDYPGYFPVGDTGALARLLSRAEGDPDFHESLRAACAERADLASQERERSEWAGLLRSLGLPARRPDGGAAAAPPRRPMTGGVAPPLPETVRAEPVGSLLRPEYLLRARRRREAGAMDAAAFKRVEDRAAREAVRVQEEAGLPVVTDGEMRRLSFQSQMTEAVEGFGDPGLEAFTWGRWRGDGEVGDRVVPRPEGVGVTGELRRRRSLSGEEFVFLRARTDRLPKVTLPSPGLFANFWSPGDGGPYATLGGFLEEVASVLEAEARRLAELGCRYLQIDAPHYPLLLDEEVRSFYESLGWGRERWIREGAELENRVMEAAPGVTFALHMCRGNQASRWLARGGYGPLTEVFRRTRARRLLLEYDDERSGGFGPLEEVPDDRVVVLGLITTKRGGLEEPGRLERRVREAAERVPLERLAVSTQCGFGTSVLGNRLSAREQAEKLALVARTAGRVWGS